MVKAMN
jgi:hypothetical protein